MLFGAIDKNPIKEMFLNKNPACLLLDLFDINSNMKLQSLLHFLKILFLHRLNK